MMDKNCTPLIQLICELKTENTKLKERQKADKALVKHLSTENEHAHRYRVTTSRYLNREKVACPVCLESTGEIGRAHV